MNYHQGGQIWLVAHKQNCLNNLNVYLWTKLQIRESYKF